MTVLQSGIAVITVGISTVGVLFSACRWHSQRWYLSRPTIMGLLLSAVSIMALAFSISLIDESKAMDQSFFGHSIVFLTVNFALVLEALFRSEDDALVRKAMFGQERCNINAKSVSTAATGAPNSTFPASPLATRLDRAGGQDWASSALQPCPDTQSGSLGQDKLSLIARQPVTVHVLHSVAVVDRKADEEQSADRTQATADDGLKLNAPQPKVAFANESDPNSTTASSAKQQASTAKAARCVRCGTPSQALMAYTASIMVLGAYAITIYFKSNSRSV